MNTAAILNTLSMVNNPETKQEQLICNTNGFFDLLSVLLDSLGGTDSRISMTDGKSVKNKPDLADEGIDQETERNTLAEQSMVSALQIFQLSPKVEVSMSTESGMSEINQVKNPNKTSQPSTRNIYFGNVNSDLMVQNLTSSIKSEDEVQEIQSEQKADITKLINVETKKLYATEIASSDIRKSEGTDIPRQQQSPVPDIITADEDGITNTEYASSEISTKVTHNNDSGSFEKTRIEGEQTSSGRIQSTGDKSDADANLSTGEGMSMFKIEQSANALELVEKTKEVYSSDEIKNSAASQISSQVLDTLRKGQSDFKLTLKPEGLGEIEVKMTLDGNGLSMKINTELVSTQKLISLQLPQLRQELAAGQQIITSLGVELRQNGYPPQQFNGYNRQSQQQSTNFEKAMEFQKSDEETIKFYTLAQPSYGLRINYRI